MYKSMRVLMFAAMCLIVALALCPVMAFAQSGGGGGGQGGGGDEGGGGGEETTSTNLSYPASFFGSTTLTGTIGSYNLTGTLGDGMSYGCAKPETIGTTTYPNTSCVVANPDGTFTAESKEACQEVCTGALVERIYWQKSTKNVWQGGYGVPMSTDAVPVPLKLAADYIDWGDNLESKSWPVQTIRVEVNTFSTLAAPAEGAPNTQLRFDVWHVFGQGTNELWGAHATDAEPTVPYTYNPWPYAVNFGGDARMDISKLVKSADTCPTTATGTTQSPFQGDKNLTWTVDDPNTGVGHWVDAAYTSQGVGKITPELNIKGSYVYGYNWNLKSEPVPGTISKSGWWRLTFYTADKSIDFLNWLAPDVAGYNTLGPPASDLLPMAGATVSPLYITAGSGSGSGGGGGQGGGGQGGGGGGEEGGETGSLYVAQVDKTNQLTYLDICISGGTRPGTTTTSLTYSPDTLYAGSSVTLTATVTSDSGTPTGTVTFFDGSTMLGTAELDSTGTAKYTVPDFAAGSHSCTASYGGEMNYATSTSSAVVVTVAPASFGLNVANPQATVRAGQSAAYNVSVSPMGNFTEPVALACSGLPAESACEFAPPTVTPGRNAVQTMLTIRTTARTGTAATLPVHPPFDPRWLLSVALTLLTSLALLFTFKRSEAGRRQAWRFASVGTLLLAFGLAVSGCGGDSSSALTPSVATGTPAGTYTVVVTGTSTSQTTSSQVILNVQ